LAVKEQIVQGSEKVVETTGVPAQAAKAAGEITTYLARAYKNLHFYDANNPVPRESVERLFTALTSFLESYETLTYTLTETELCYQGKPVYANPDRRESLVFKLYRDGVRAVSFHSGIAVDDLTWLLETLSRTKAGCEDAAPDVVTQMWERELAHITYIAVDDYFELEDAEEEPARGGHEGETGAVCGQPATQDGPQDGSYGLAPVADLTPTDDERRSTLDLVLTEHELGEVGQQMLAEENDDPRVKVSRIFLDVVRSQAPLEIRTDATRVLQTLCTAFLEAGKPAEAALLLSEIKRIPVEEDQLPPELSVILDSFIEARGLEKELAPLEPRIEDAAPSVLAGYAQYLSELNPNSVGPLCNMLGRLKTRKSRDMLCRVLSVVAKQNLTALVGHLSDQRWYLVRNMVYLLRLMKEKHATSYLEPLTKHEDLRVRTELVHCLAEIGGDQAQVLLAKLLNDVEKTIRLLAAKKLGQAGGKRAAALLSEYMCQGAFVKRDSGEKSEVFDALGRTGTDDALPVLEKLIRKRSLMNWAETNEMKKCAIMAAGRLGTNRAHELLERTARDTRGRLRKASLDALRLCGLNVSQGGSHE